MESGCKTYCICYQYRSLKSWPYSWASWPKTCEPCGWPGNVWEQFWKNKFQKCKQFSDIVLQRCSSQQESMTYSVPCQRPGKKIKRYCMILHSILNHTLPKFRRSWTQLQPINKTMHVESYNILLGFNDGLF